MGERADEINRRDELDDLRRETEAAATAPDDDASTEELRQEIEQTRVEMSSTIDAIQQKLAPEVLAEQAKEAAREAAEHAVQNVKETVREATVGKAEEVVRNVSDTAQDVMHSAGDTADEARYTLVETVKRNPMPAALAGIGLAWLFMNRESRPAHARSTYYQGQTPPSYTGRPVRYQGASTPGWNQGWTSTGYAAGQRYSGTRTAGEDQGGVGETVDRAKEAAGQAAERVQETAEQAADRVQATARRAGDTAGDVGSTLMDTIRQNPVPAALAGISLGWLFMNRPGAGGGTSSYRSSYQPYSYGRGERGYSYGGGGGAGVTDRAQEVAGRAQETAGQAAERVQETAGQAAERVQETAGQAAERVQETAGQLGDQAQYLARRTQYGFQETLQESPLTIGAAALVLGFLAGFSVPKTEAEERLMGGARDTVMERAQTVAQEAVGRVQQVAEQVGDTAQREMQSATQDVGNVAQREAQGAAQDIGRTAQQAARNQGQAQ